MKEDYFDRVNKNGINYEIEIKENKLYFSEYEDMPYGRNNGTDCDVKEFYEGKTEDAIRVQGLISSFLGEEKLKDVIRIAGWYI